MSTSTTIKYGQALKQYRSIAQLLRRDKEKVSSMPVLEHIRQTIRQHNVTDQRLCRAPEELNYLADCYKTYLEAGHQYRQLYSKYYGKGEKTVAEAARTVGLKLPKMKKD